MGEVEAPLVVGVGRWRRFAVESSNFSSSVRLIFVFELFRLIWVSILNEKVI